MSVFLATSPRFGVFAACVVGLGAATGLHYSTATSLLTRTYDNIGTAVGIHTIGAPAGGLIAPIVAAWISIRYGWRPAVAIGGVIAVPMFVLFAQCVYSAQPLRPDQSVWNRFRVRPILKLLSRPPIVFTAVIASIGAFVWQGTASFLPTFLIDYRGQSPTMAGLLFSMYFVVQAVVKPGLGILSDRYDRDLAIAICVITSALGMIFFVIGPGFISIIGGIILVGAGLGMAVAVEPRFIDELAEDEQGIGFGLVRTVYLVVASLGSVTVGFFTDLFGWAVSFGILICLLLFVLCALVANWRWDLDY